MRSVRLGDPGAAVLTGKPTATAVSRSVIHLPAKALLPSGCNMGLSKAMRVRTRQVIYCSARNGSAQVEGCKWHPRPTSLEQGGTKRPHNRSIEGRRGSEGHTPLTFNRAASHAAKRTRQSADATHGNARRPRAMPCSQGALCRL